MSLMIVMISCVLQHVAVCVAVCGAVYVAVCVAVNAAIIIIHTYDVWMIMMLIIIMICIIHTSRNNDKLIISSYNDVNHHDHS